MRTLTLAAAVILFSAPAIAADESTSATTNNQEVVCKTLAANTGTRLGQRKICLTRAEWDARRQHDQQGLTQSQDTALSAAPPGQ